MTTAGRQVAAYLRLDVESGLAGSMEVAVALLVPSVQMVLQLVLHLVKADIQANVHLVLHLVLHLMKASIQANAQLSLFHRTLE
jgi:hypothetical protein